MAEPADRGDQQAEGEGAEHGAPESNGCGARRLRGRERIAISEATTPIGTLTANSQGQFATESMAAATVGPIAEETATSSALMPIPRPSRRARIDEADQRAVHAHDAGGAEALHHPRRP